MLRSRLPAVLAFLVVRQPIASPCTVFLAARGGVVLTGKQESTQVTVSQGACGELADDRRRRLGVLLGVPQHLDPELEFLISSWSELPRHVRITIRTILAATAAQARISPTGAERGP